MNSRGVPCLTTSKLSSWSNQLMFCTGLDLLLLQIEDHMASIVIAQLLLLQTENSKAPIHMYINSPGGVVTAGLAIYDTMQYVRPPISTWCVGQACSAASLLLAAGSKGMRNALPHSRIMVHQPSGGAQVSAVCLITYVRQHNSFCMRAQLSLCESTTLIVSEVLTE